MYVHNTRQYFNSIHVRWKFLHFFTFNILAFQHRLFVDGQPDLLYGMKRVKIKGIAGKSQLKLFPTKPEVAPNHEVDNDEDHAEDNETDDESDIS